MSVPLPTPRESVDAALALLRSGLWQVYRPDHLVRLAVSLAQYQMGPAAGAMVGAIVYPDAVGIVDETSTATMRELDQRSSAVARGLYAAGFRAGDAIGLLARNSAAFYEATVGASRLGIDLTYLNTGFVAGQVAEVADQRRLTGLIYDQEFADRIPATVRKVVTVEDGSHRPPSLAAMAAGPSRPPPPRPTRPGRHIILTSGTTGRPKAVARSGGGVASVIALLSGLPLRVRETHLIAAPLFHAWGWLNMLLTMLLSGTVVVRRRFDAQSTLAQIEHERCHVLIAVPSMLRQIMDLPVAVRRRYDTTSLRVVAVSGSALSPSLAGSFMDEFGEILFSLYGSTEAAYATVATPVDLRGAPGTAGRPLPMVRVRVVDQHGRDRPRGQRGRIVVHGRDTVAADQEEPGPTAMRTGDLGWIDEAGRLFVAGREDDMVIVGGENVYPIGVEQTLEEHPDIVEAAVVGAPDRRLGQVLVAHVVIRPGAALTAETIRDWCRTRLARYQVPHRVIFHERLPHGETGKIVKRSLAP
jgi:acyl-CoA synthetase (AMP-forming)/AMP-acid ligase II